MIYYEDWYTNIPMKVYSASKLSLSGILRGFHPVSDFIPEFHGDFPLDLSKFPFSLLNWFMQSKMFFLLFSTVASFGIFNL